MNLALPVKLGILFALLISYSLWAAPVGEHAGEIWVDGPDSEPALNPVDPDAAVGPFGKSFFVWAGNPAINGGTDVFLRIFDSSGGSPTVPVVVNTLLENNQRYPRVAVSGDGTFLVTWQSDEVPDGGNARRKIVRSQAFNADAQEMGDEQLLSTLPTLLVSPVSADVASLRDGGYVVAWQSSETNGEDTPNSIQAIRLGADGVPLGEQFQVNSNNSVGSERGSAVTGLLDGRFLVVWARDRTVYGRRFAADGTPAGDDFQIHTSTTGQKYETDVVQHQDGRILVTWKDDDDAENNWEIRGRMFSQNLTAMGSDFRINTVITGGQTHARVADYGQGGFFVVWESPSSAGNDNEPNSIEGRIVSGNNQFAGPQFLVNQWTEDNQATPGIGGRGGRIAVAWDSRTSPDSSTRVILGQFWSVCGIFCDSFEGE
jgi:hypothetical protein